MAKKHSTTSGENGNVLLPLSAESASINTATITIRTVQVGKKQMTQSVFRQLPKAPMVDEVKVELLGVPWGWVNYRWGDIDDQETNFIHQIGGRLYRCAFLVRDSITFNRGLTLDGLLWNPIPFSDIQNYMKNLAFALKCASILEGWRPGGWVESEYACWDWEMIFCSSPCQIYHHKTDIKLTLEKDYKIHLDYVFSSSPYCNHYAAQKNECSSILRNLIGEICGRSDDSSQILEKINRHADHASDYCRRWDTLMAQLRTVEQLFIAV